MPSKLPTGLICGIEENLRKGYSRNDNSFEEIQIKQEMQSQVTLTFATCCLQLGDGYSLDNGKCGNLV
jgi:hypothetical protein